MTIGKRPFRGLELGVSAYLDSCSEKILFSACGNFRSFRVEIRERVGHIVHQQVALVVVGDVRVSNQSTVCSVSRVTVA
jgi:hypothetical protein